MGFANVEWYALWIPMAAAMVGLSSSVPLWTGQDWQPILGTLVDTRILSPHLSSKESLLLLSQWIRIPRDDLHIRHATNSWLSPDKVNVALGPDCDLSPHPAREVPLNISTPYIDMLLGPQKPARGQPKQASEQEDTGGQLWSIRCVCSDSDSARWNSHQVQKSSYLDPCSA